jgi:hypothetical protein
MTDQQISDILRWRHNDLVPSVTTAGHIALLPPGNEAATATRRHEHEDQAGARKHFEFLAGPPLKKRPLNFSEKSTKLSAHASVRDRPDGLKVA